MVLPALDLSMSAACVLVGAVGADGADVLSCCWRLGLVSMVTDLFIRGQAF